jgi:hypothetical protein
MTNSNLIAIVLLFVAIADTLLARHVLPRIFTKNPAMSEKQKSAILKYVNQMTFVFAGGAILVYATQYFG